MARFRSTAALAALGLGVAGLCGCNGQPEDTGGAADASQVQTPPPAMPAWVGPVLGRPLSLISRGSTTCKGAIDVVSAKHVGKVKGSEVQGWSFDEGGRKPFDRVVFTTATNSIVGAANVGLSRKDVPPAVPEVKTPNVGWSGVMNITEGGFRAYGVSAAGATCLIGTSAL